MNNDRRTFLMVALALVGLLITMGAWRLAFSPAPLPPAAPIRQPEGARQAPTLDVPATRTAIRDTAARQPQPTALVPPEEADLAHPYAFSLQVQFVDVYGGPVREALVFAAPDECGFCRASSRSDARGRVLLAWQGRAETMRVRVAGLAYGVMQSMRLVELRAGQLKTLCIPVEAERRDPATMLRDVARDGTERNAWRRKQMKSVVARARSGAGDQSVDELDVLCGRTMLMFRSFDCLECHDASRVRPYRLLANAGEMRASLHPFARFSDMRRTKADSEELRVRRAKRYRELKDAASHESRPAGGGEAVLAGTVIGADGEPAGGVPISLVDAEGSVLRSTRANARGQYRLPSLPAGQQRFVAGGMRHGQCDAYVAIPSRGTVPWDPLLVRSGEVQGYLVGLPPHQLAGMRVELVRREGDWAGFAQVDDDGFFRTFSVPGPVDCLVWPQQGQGTALPVHHGVSSLIDAGPVRITLHAELPMRARFRVHIGLPEQPARPADQAEAIIDARLIQHDSGRLVLLDALGFEDALVAEPLAAGGYTLEVGTAACGWVRSERVQLDGRGLWDLGRINLPKPGRIRLLAADGPDRSAGWGLSFYRRTESVDIHEHAHWIDARTCSVPAGRHVVVWRDGDRLRAHEVIVRSDELIELALVPEAPPSSARGR
ncbi:MAG: carboxypeptidase regulatory-like domain-containing protein [Planctomycetota bacterium]